MIFSTNMRPNRKPIFQIAAGSLGVILVVILLNQSRNERNPKYMVERHVAKRSSELSLFSSSNRHKKRSNKLERKSARPDLYIQMSMWRHLVSQFGNNAFASG